MKRFLTVLMIAVMVILSGCESQPEESISVTYTEAENITVYITKTGECYHKEDCTCLNKSKIARSLDIASKRFRPCQICYPPIIEE